MKHIFDITAEEARDYMLKGNQYCTFRLPEYFVFDQALALAEKNIGARDASQYCALDKEKGNGKRVKPSNYDGVNYMLFSNKDGKLDYRPLTLINPFYYYLLVRLITTPEAWKEIVDRYNALKDSHISVESIPIVEEGNKDKKTIFGWWSHVEQRSIELSFIYKYMFVTDITNCYGSIYTHAIAWAMMGIDKAKEHRGDSSLLGNKIDVAFQGMQYGQTNGIPQGNIVSDLIAEMVLAYTDSLIAEKAKEKGIARYHIIRYRDDYRVFCDDKNHLEELALVMQKVLAIFNFKINSSKTSIEEDLVLGSLKKDKIAMLNLFIHRNGLDVEKLKSDKSLFQKDLLAIYSFSKQYPNSGSVERLLGDFYDCFKTADFKNCNGTVLAAILVSIAKDNPRTYGIVAALISLLVESMDKEKRDNLILDIHCKVTQWPNSSLLMAWLQRITLKMDEKFIYDDPICRVVEGDNINLWNNDWLDDSLKTGFCNDMLISKNVIASMTSTIEKRYVSPFYRYEVDEE